MRTLARLHSPFRQSILVGLLAALLLAAVAPLAAVAAPVEFVLKPPVGEELVYRVSMRAAEAAGPTAPPSPIPVIALTVDLHLRLEAPDANGVYPFEYWVENGTMQIFGMSAGEVVDSAKRKGSIVLRPEVKILTIEESPILNEIGVIMKELIHALFPQYPTHPLQIGDRWSYTFDLGDAEFRRPVSVTQTLQSLNETDNTATFRVESLLEFSVEFDFEGVLTTVSTAVRGQGTDIVDRSTGMLFRSTQENRESSLITDTLGYSLPAYFVTNTSIERILQP